MESTLKQPHQNTLEQIHFNAIEQQIRPWHVAHSQLIDLLRTNPRHLFLKGQIDAAYVDQHLKLDEARLFQGIGLKFEGAESIQTSQKVSYLLSPKLEARLLQIIIERLELQIQDLYEKYQIWQEQSADAPAYQKDHDLTLKVVMLGADTGYIPHILNSLIQSQYYHEALEIDSGFKVHLKMTIIEPNTNLLTLLSANLQEQHAAHLSSFKIMQNALMNQIPMNEDLQESDLIFATSSSPYLLPIYQQILREGGAGIAFIGERLHDCNLYQQQNINERLQLVKQETLFETWVPAFNVVAPKVFVF